MTVLVQDDGDGFDRRRSADDGRDGLDGMAERARLLGGTFELDSTPGWGTRVRAWIPMPSGDRPGPAPARPLRVLVVDDHAATRAGIVRLLSSADPASRSSARPARARGASAPGARSVPTSCSWTSRCPTATAIEAIATIRAEDPSATVVALSAFASDESVAGAIRAGARGYVGKDASAAELAAAVSAASRGGTCCRARPPSASRPA